MSNNLAKHSHELSLQQSHKLSLQQRKIYAPCPTHHFGCPSISDVALHLYNTFYRSHRLQIDCNDERKVAFPGSIKQERQGEQNAIRYSLPNYVRTDNCTLAHILTCNQETVLLVHTGSGSKPTSANSESSNQTLKLWCGGATWVHTDTWLQLPGAAHRSTTRFTPNNFLKKKVFVHQLATVGSLYGKRFGCYSSKARKQAGQAGTMEDVELLVYLEELEGAASSPPFFLGLPVVDVLSNRRRIPVRSGEQSGGEGATWRGGGSVPSCPWRPCPWRRQGGGPGAARRGGGGGGRGKGRAS